jgi:2',3'-cyclic-nucleotide 2'-phosphodiesterase (5'-nucleotidase family)
MIPYLEVRMKKKLMSAALVISLISSVLSVFPTQTSALDVFPFVLMATANVRGQLEPFSSGPMKDQGGLTKVASVVNRLRTETEAREGYTMLIDVGNTLSGTGITNYFGRRPLAGKPHPSVALMNHMKYDAAGYTALDFSTTPQFRDARKRESSFTWVSSNAFAGANLYAADHRMLIYDVPDSAHVLKIAIISPPDPEKLQAVPRESVQGLEFYDPAEEVIRLGDVLKVIDRADFLVLMTDMEWEQDEAKRKDSMLYRILERSRIDIAIVASDEVIPGEQVLFGDTDEFLAHDVLITSPGRYGIGVSRVELMLEKCKCPVKPYETLKKENGARMITGKVVKVGPAIKEDPSTANVLREYKQAVGKDFGEVAGFAKETFSLAGSNYGPGSLSNLALQTIQLTSKAPIAMFKPGGMIQNLNKGPLTAGDIQNAFSMDDTIYTVTLNGARIKSILEEVADYLLDGQMAYAINTSGLSYTMDLRQTRGNRIKDLKHAGQNINPSTNYTVGVLSSLLKGSNIPRSLRNLSIQQNTRKTLRDELVELFRERKEIAPVTSGQWFLVPDYLDHWANEAVAFLQGKKVISGYTDGRFLPNRTISRAEYTTIVTKAYGISEVKPSTPSYTDVQPKDWFYGIVEAAKVKGMLPFAEGNHFFPDKAITREEAMIQLVVALRNEASPPQISEEAMKMFKESNKDSASISALALPYLAFAAAEGLIRGYPDGTIRPKGSITRAETATIVFRAHYPTIMIAATGNVASTIHPAHNDPYEDRPIGGLTLIDAHMKRISNSYANFIAIDAGNYLMGSSVSYLTKGEAIGEIYQKIGYQAIGVSDEDFFYGLDAFRNVGKKGNIPQLAADLSPFDSHYYKNFGNIKVGISAVSGFSVEKPRLHENVSDLIEIHNAIEKANEATRKMVQDGSNIQVIMTGIKGNVNMMGEVSENLKLFLDGLNPKPSLVVALNQLYGFTLEYKGIQVLGPGSFGNSIGTGKFVMNAVTKKIESVELHKAFAYADELEPSKEILSLYQGYEKQYESQLNRLVGRSQHGMTSRMGGESQLGNLISDIMRNAVDDASFGFIVSSLIRGDLPAGNIQARHIYDALTKDEDLVVVDLMGYDIRMALEHGATFSHGMIQISGIKFQYNNFRFLYDRVVGIDIMDSEEEYDDTATYRIIITESMRRGIDGYFWLGKGDIVRYLDQSLRQEVFNYIEAEHQKGNMVDRDIEGRIYLIEDF